MKLDLNYDCTHPDHVRYGKAEASSAASLIGTIAGEGSLESTTVVVETYKERNALAIFNPDSKGTFQLFLPAERYIVMAFRKGDSQQTANPVWITRTTAANVWLRFPSAKSGIIACQ